MVDIVSALLKKVREDACCLTLHGRDAIRDKNGGVAGSVMSPDRGRGTI